MNEQFHSLLSVVIIPQVIDLISKEECIDEIEAIDQFYSSKTYDSLCDEKTKTWHYGPLALFEMWKQERKTGKLIYPDEDVHYE